MSYPKRTAFLVNDTQSAENEIIQLMLYREGLSPQSPSARESYKPLERRMEALVQKLPDAHSRTFGDSDDAGSQGTRHNFET